MPDRMQELTSKQRAHLRRLAHHLKPVVWVGGDGVTDAVRRSVEEAFHTRELIKVKALESAPEPIGAVAARLAGDLPGVRVAQTIGRTAVLYRRDPEEPEIRLPTPGR